MKCGAAGGSFHSFYLVKVKKPLVWCSL